MKFHKLTDTCKPEPNRDVIVRVAGEYDPFGDKLIPIPPYLYVVIKQDQQEPVYVYSDEPNFELIRKDYHDTYVEARGEGYASFLDCEISHWCYATDILEEIEEESDEK